MPKELLIWEKQPGGKDKSTAFVETPGQVDNEK